MENRIPLPTDNIYKFYALFGLLLFVFGVGSSIYVNQSTNDFIFKTHVELATLNQIGPPTAAEATKKADLQRLLEVAVQNRQFCVVGVGVLMGIGLLLMIYGFGKWQKEIQPIQDEMARLGVEKLKLEVAALKAKEAASAPASVSGAVGDC